MKGTREERARALVEDGAVMLPDLPVATILWELHHGGSIPVVSQTNPMRLYHVNGSCQCADYRRHEQDNPRHLCKHRLAVKISLLERIDAEGTPPKPARHVPPRWTREERTERAREEWASENICRNECGIFVDGVYQYTLCENL